MVAVARGLPDLEESAGQSRRAGNLPSSVVGNDLEVEGNGSSHLGEQGNERQRSNEGVDDCHHPMMPALDVGSFVLEHGGELILLQGRAQSFGDDHTAVFLWH